MIAPDVIEKAEVARLRARLERERRTRLEAEAISERITRDLYDGRRELELLQAITTAANQSYTIEEAFQTALDKVCQYMEWPVGHLFWPAPDGSGELVSSQIWHLSHPQRFENFRRISEAMQFHSGLGLPGRVLAGKRAVWARDVNEDANFPRAKLAFEIGVRAGFAFPVMVGSEVAAVLEFFSERALEPNEQLMEIMTHVGTQVGRVIERHRAEQKLKVQFNRLNLLHHINRTIAESEDLDSLVNVVLGQLEDHLAIDLGCVCMLDAKAEMLTVSTFRRRGMAPQPRNEAQNAVISVRESGLWETAQGQTVCISDTSKHHALMPQWLARAGMGSMVVVPLIAASRVFGILLVARAGTGAFDPEEAEFLRTLSSHVAVAAHQVRLHANLRKAYEELRQTQQAVMEQERLRALGQMASGIAHDINNAVSPVVGYAEILLRSATDPTTARHLQSIKTAGEDISHIVARLREFYRVREKGDELSRIKLNDLVRQVVDLTRPRWRDIQQEHGVAIQIKLELAKSLPDVIGNASELREALTNLVFNATDAMPRGGVLTLRTSVRTPWGDGLAEGTREVVMEVCDTGIGMDAETRQKCLEPFYTTKGDRGTGLGLAMVYGVVQRHNCQLEIESELRKGTTMRVIFPPGEGLLSEDPALSPAAVEVSPMRILYIDDEPLLRDLMKSMLGSHGHRVQVADDGESGLGAFRNARDRSEPFDVVITDLGMPYMDGRQVAHMLKTESPTTPVIMMTGWGSMLEEDEEPLYVDSVISKPPQMMEISKALHNLQTKRNEQPMQRLAVAP